MSTIYTLMVVGWILSSVVMLIFWLWHRRLGNAAVVDVGWTGLVAGLSVFYAATGSGAPIRRFAIAVMLAIWGTRLIVYLLKDRVFGRPEDPRYQDLRRHRGAGAGI